MGGVRGRGNTRARASVNLQMGQVHAHELIHTCLYVPMDTLCTAELL
jgi:hypothetical protein